MGTELQSVACNNCGASLTIGETTRFVTCSHCGSQLSVQHTDDSTFTELLTSIHQNTEHLASEIRSLKLQNQLEALDREWQVQREELMVSGKNGHKYRPTVASSLLLGGVMVIVGLVFASTHGGFGLLLAAVAVVVAIYGWSKAVAFDAAEAKYKQQRAIIERQLHE